MSPMHVRGGGEGHHPPGSYAPLQVGSSPVSNIPPKPARRDVGPSAPFEAIKTKYDRSKSIELFKQLKECLASTMLKGQPLDRVVSWAISQNKITTALLQSWVNAIDQGAPVEINRLYQLARVSAPPQLK